MTGFDFKGSSEAWLAAIVESSDDAIVGKTLDSVIRSWNAGARRIFGYEPSEIIGRSVLTLIPPDRRFEEAEILGRLARGERVDQFETVRVRRDGTPIDVSLSVSPIRGGTGEIVGAAKIARDITESKRLLAVERELTEQLQAVAGELEQQVEESQALQEELEETNEQLAKSLAETLRVKDEAEVARAKAAAESASKTQFLATVSHELRTPLNAIVGYVDLLEMGLRGPVSEEQRHDLARIKRSGQALHRLIDDVLTFSKFEAGKLTYRYEPVPIDEVLATIETFVAPRLAEKRLEYRVELCGSGTTVWADRPKLEQILINLLSNAVKFTDQGGIRVACSARPDTIHLDVQDTGRGIPVELLEDIFKPFVRGEQSLSRTVDGTGLGLFISRELARGMGGEISVVSRHGVGSTFTLHLPRA